MHCREPFGPLGTIDSYRVLSRFGLFYCPFAMDPAEPAKMKGPALT
jgi:hypothetical protein